MAKAKGNEKPQDVFIHVALDEGGRARRDSVVKGMVFVRHRFNSEIRPYSKYADVLKYVAANADKNVYIQGNWATAPLLCRLLDDGGFTLGSHVKYPENGRRLFIGGPVCAGGHTGYSAVLAYMASCRQPPSVGGWHTASGWDVAVYRLVSSAIPGASLESVDDERKVEALMPLLEAHPAWSALSFIPTLHHGCAMKLMACLVDPRFHIDIANPNSWEPIETYLGRHHLKQVYETMVRSNQLTVGWSEPQHRAAIWTLAWNGPDSNGDIGRGVHPSDFLRRLKPVQAGVTFLRFVLSSWLHNVVGPSHRLFVPGDFLDTDRASEAWNSHIRTLV